MKARYLLPFVFAIVAAAIAFALAHRATPSRACGTESSLDDVSFLVEQLDLTDDQAVEAARLQEGLRSEIEKHCARHCSSRARLGEAIAANKNDQEVEIILEQMTKAYIESERDTVRHIREVRALLTEEQKEEYDSLLARCVCTVCEACEHSMERPQSSARGQEEITK